MQVFAKLARILFFFVIRGCFVCSQRCCAAPFHTRRALNAAGFTRAQHLSRPKGHQIIWYFCGVSLGNFAAFRLVTLRWKCHPNSSFIFLSCVARDAAQPLSHPKGLTRRRLYPCAAPFTPEGPYTPQAIPPLLLHLITLLLRYALQYYSFVGKGVKRGKRRLLFIYNIYIIYIIVNIFTYIFCYFSSLSADDGLIKKL